METGNQNSGNIIPKAVKPPILGDFLKEFLKKQPPEVVLVIEQLLQYISVLEAALEERDLRIQALEKRVRELEARLSMDSHNSSKPPSSEGYKKPPVPKSLRKQSGKKPGGQKGHTGETLERVSTPDQTIRHEPSQCTCGCCLEQEPGDIHGQTSGL
jgi:hypothetical protein